VAGIWRVVVLRTEGGAGVDVEARVGATAPDLGLLASGLLVVGGVLLAAGALLVGLAVRSAQRGRGEPAARPTPPPPSAGPPDLPLPRPPGETQQHADRSSPGG
jgi:hypothetical protein